MEHACTLYKLIGHLIVSEQSVAHSPAQPALRCVLKACNLKMSYFKNVPSHLLCWCNLIGRACVARGNHLLLYEEAYRPN